MRQLRTITAALVAAVLGGMMLAPVAGADPADTAIAALRTRPIYAGASSPTIDQGSFSASSLNGFKVAIVPTGGPDPVAVAQRIGSALDPKSNGLTVLVFEGTSYGAASSSHCAIKASIDSAVQQNLDTLKSTNNVTSTVSSFVSKVNSSPSSSNGCAGSGSAGSGFGDSAKKASHTGVIVLLVILALVLAGGGWLLISRRRRMRRQLADARAQVMPFYDRLAHEINTLEPGDNDVAQQAVADASERFTSAGSQLATADTTQAFERARRTTLEGLYAARTARTALGLDPGPDLPPITESSAEQLSAPQQVTVQGQTFQGYPSYTPGAPYYYGGGYGVPGGWYGSPFWETLLLGSLLTGGLGGFGGGGYGSGYDSGYQSGYDAGQDSNNGGGWGDSGGGGGWGGGGGGWGDSGGGGWGGGGGGDWGGGGGGGGDSGGGSW
jgi:hypothetical protein